MTECNFKKGEKILVRDNEEREWQQAEFICYAEKAAFPFVVYRTDDDDCDLTKGYLFARPLVEEKEEIQLYDVVRFGESCPMVVVCISNGSYRCLYQNGIDSNWFENVKKIHDKIAVAPCLYKDNNNQNYLSVILFKNKKEALSYDNTAIWPSRLSDFIIVDKF